MTDRPDYSKPPSEDAATGERLIPDVAPVGGGDAIASEDAAPDDEGAKPKRKRSYPFWVEVPVLMVLALLFAVVIKTFLVQAFFIPSESMLDTLRVDDRILVNKLAFRFGEPNRGDVVVFDSGELRQESILEAVRRNLAESVGLSAPESDFVKRVIAVAGRGARDTGQPGVRGRRGAGRIVSEAGYRDGRLRPGDGGAGSLLHDG